MNTRKLFPQAPNSFSRLLAAATRPVRLLGLSVFMFGLLGSSMALHAQTPMDPTGTWIIEVSFNGAACSPGDTVQFQCVYGLLTFHADGTLSEVDTFASGAKQSFGAGVWKLKTGSTNVFNTTFEQLQFSGAGSPSHYDVVWGPVTVSGDSLTSSGGFASYDFYNNPITMAGYAGSFTTVGKKMNPPQTGPGAEPAP